MPQLIAHNNPDRTFPGDRTDAEWYENLPKPTGGTSLAEVKKYIPPFTNLAALQETFEHGPSTPVLDKLHGKNPEIPGIIANSISVRVRNAMRWAGGVLTPEQALEGYKSDYARWPKHLQDLMPWAEIERRLLQRVGTSGNTQLERASDLNRGGVLAGFSMYGQPFVVDGGIVGVGLSYNEIAERNKEYGFYFLPNGALKNRAGTVDGMTYEEQVICANFGVDGILPAIPSNRPGEPEYNGCYMHKREARQAPYMIGRGIVKRTEPDQAIDNVGAFRMMPIRDIERKAD